jgi:hypothetical protein
LSDKFLSVIFWGKISKKLAEMFIAEIMSDIKSLPLLYFLIESAPAPLQMNKLLREVPTMESWLNEGSSEFVQVTLHKDFIQLALVKLRKSIEHWLNEPKEFCDAIGRLSTSLF